LKVEILKLVKRRMEEIEVQFRAITRDEVLRLMSLVPPQPMR
jgi:hypothetical protein